ncbi:MAG: helix-turn-helix domain-containing protein, partial [Thermodesulfovibrionaceae bacterium]
MSDEFKKRRLELGKTIEEISNETKIKKSYLLAIEESKFDELPIEVYSKSYIKTYAQLLGIDPQKKLAEYDNYLRKVKEKM